MGEKVDKSPAKRVLCPNSGIQFNKLVLVAVQREILTLVICPVLSTGKLQTKRGGAKTSKVPYYTHYQVFTVHQQPRTVNNQRKP